MGCLECLEVTGCEALKSDLSDLYEFHITVEEADVNKFREDCNSIGVKPILLDLHLANGGVMKDLMTSSTFRGSYSDACIDIMVKAVALEKMGYKVLRQKIETTPLNPLVPNKQNKLPLTQGQYFESHILVYIENKVHRWTIDFIIPFYDGHLSKNTFKKGDKAGTMFTMRGYDCPYEDFQSSVDEVVVALKLGGIAFERPIVEFTIMDTNIKHDSAWTGHK